MLCISLRKLHRTCLSGYSYEPNKLPWARNEPNDLANNEDFAFAFGDLVLTDENADFTARPICEFAIEDNLNHAIADFEYVTEIDKMPSKILFEYTNTSVSVCASEFIKIQKQQIIVQHK